MVINDFFALLQSYLPLEAISLLLRDVIASVVFLLIWGNAIVHLLKERFDDEFTEFFGIQPTALTANEASYLVGFASIDGL